MVERSPTLLRRWIGSELRRLREAAKISRTQVNERFLKSKAWCGHIETGEYGLSVGDLETLLDWYGHPERKEFFVSLLEAVRSNADWWETDLFSSASPPWLDQLLGLESIAAEVQTYDSMVPNGLVQTAATARAVISGAEPSLDADEVARRAALRIARQAAWHGRDGTDPLIVTSVIDEAALLRPIGGSDVHRDQLLHMADVAESTPNVTLLVLPTSVGAHPSMEGSCKMFRFPADFGDPGVIYAENRHDGVYYREPERIAATRTDLEILTTMALDTEASIERIRTLAKELYA